MRVLFDTDVVLDVLLDRRPHSVAAARLFGGVEAGEISGLLCATTMTTLAYLVGRELDRRRTKKELGKFMSLFEIAAVNRIVLQSALETDFEDFEDAVLHEAGRLAFADGIVTRNIRDFARATLAVYSPHELVAALDSRGTE